MPLVDRKEKWWVVVMGVGLNPELTKWSVRSGLVNFLTKKGYKEHHWLVVPHLSSSRSFYTTFAQLFSFYLLSPTLPTPIDLILSYLSPHMIFTLSYPSLHDHYLTSLIFLSRHRFIL